MLLLILIGGVFVAEALSVILQVTYFKATRRQAHLSHEPAAPSLRARRLARDEGHGRFWFASLALLAGRIDRRCADVHFTNEETVLVIGPRQERAWRSVEVLRARGVTVYATDEKPVERAGRSDCRGRSVRRTLRRAGRISNGSLGALTSAVLSPGVPPTSPVVQRVQDANVPVVGEIEVAYRLCKAPIVAVTGTKGKSTTTALIGHLLRACGHNVRVGGNIGNPLIKEVLDVGPQDWVVAEVSSFQLETIRAFKPRVAVLLNLAPDHLDRYYSMDEYAEAKYRIFANQSLDDWFVGNLDDARIAELHWRHGEPRIQARQLWFTLGDRRRARDDVLCATTC